MKWIAFVLVVLAAGACRGAPGQPPTPSDETPDAVRAPLEVAGLALTDSMRYPDRQLGTAYRYRADGPLRPDVYIYPRRPDETVEGQATAFRQTLEINRRRGLYSSFGVLLDRAWSPVPWAEGREVVAELRSPRQLRHSYFHVFAVGDRFVKVRVTGARDTLDPGEVRAFTTALLSENGPRGEPPGDLIATPETQSSGVTTSQP